MGKINKRLNLKNGVFSESGDGVDKKSTKDGYLDGLLEVGKKNKNVVALFSDALGSHLVDGFVDEYAERFFRSGSSEKSLVSVASGLSSSGKVSFVSLSSPVRSWKSPGISAGESNIKISGIFSKNGVNRSTGDIALMRTVKNMRIFVPCDAEEAKKITVYAANMWGSVYIRLSEKPTPTITTEKTSFNPGNVSEPWRSRGPDVIVVACGSMVYKSVMAAKKLEDDGVKATVVNCHTIRPLDDKRIIELADRAGAVVTVEDHSVFGGMGGAVAETLALNSPVPMEIVGVGGGSEESKVSISDPSIEDIFKATKRAILRK